MFLFSTKSVPPEPTWRPPHFSFYPIFLAVAFPSRGPLPLSPACDIHPPLNQKAFKRNLPPAEGPTKCPHSVFTRCVCSFRDRLVYTSCMFFIYLLFLLIPTPVVSLFFSNVIVAATVRGLAPYENHSALLFCCQFGQIFTPPQAFWTKVLLLPMVTLF